MREAMCGGLHENRPPYISHSFHQLYFELCLNLKSQIVTSSSSHGGRRVLPYVYTRISATLKKDLEKHNQQYPAITLVENRSSHDRFIIIDNTQLYHIGASLKDLGNKCFAFSRMDDVLPELAAKLLNA